MSALLRVFIQARMSSRRFPGKVLAPLQGQPLIRHVLAAVGRALPSVPLLVATSSEASDDPLALYLDTCGVPVFRGPLLRVFDRFRLCVAAYPCEWILRLSADSPRLDAQMLQAVAEWTSCQDYDLVTTVFPRTFPRGHNAELIRVSTFMQLDAAQLSEEEQEHVTPYYYHHPTRFRILNVESENPSLAELSLAVDTVEDLHRLEQLSAAESLGDAEYTLPARLHA